MASGRFVKRESKPKSPKKGKKGEALVSRETGKALVSSAMQKRGYVRQGTKWIHKSSIKDELDNSGFFILTILVLIIIWLLT